VPKDTLQLQRVCFGRSDRDTLATRSRPRPDAQLLQLAVQCVQPSHAILVSRRDGPAGPAASFREMISAAERGRPGLSKVRTGLRPGRMRLVV